MVNNSSHSSQVGDGAVAPFCVATKVVFASVSVGCFGLPLRDGNDLVTATLGLCLASSACKAVTLLLWSARAAKALCSPASAHAIAAFCLFAYVSLHPTVCHTCIA